MMIFTCFMFLPLMVLLLGANRNPSFEWLLGVEITAGKGNPPFAALFPSDLRLSQGRILFLLLMEGEI